MTDEYPAETETADECHADIRRDEDRLVRDERGEPVRRLVTRDHAGRFIRPYYGFIWRTP